jgi:hypothetical protein
MLRSMWRYLTNDRARAPRRPTRAFTCRPTLEGLEDRVTPSSATQVGSTLNIVADPGTTSATREILLQVDSTKPSKLDVKDSGTLLGQFTISSINHVNVQVAGNDVISVNDNNGFPFAPGTGIFLLGSGSNNKLAVVGNRSVAGTGVGGESFVGGTSTQDGSLALFGPNVLFDFTGAISRVSDEVPDIQPLQVQTTAPNIDLTGTNGVIETLDGLASGTGGGNILSFSGKQSVELQLRADNENATLNATAAAKGLASFGVTQFGNGDFVDINATPTFAGIPSGGTYISNSGFDDHVNLAANSGLVSISGTFSTEVILGSGISRNATNFSKSVTSGINGLVQIHQVGTIDVEDAGNAKTKENVTVTESSITGTGLFGPNGSVQYQYTPEFQGDQESLFFFTGQLAETYTFTASSPTASFSPGQINLTDNSSTGGLTVKADVDPFTRLSLSLSSSSPANSSLFVSAGSGANFNPSVMTAPNGFEDVTFPTVSGSTGGRVNYGGFDTVGHS